MASSVAGTHVAAEEGSAAVGLRAVVERVRSEDESCRIEAAKDIRRLTKTSSKNRRHLSNTIEPLVGMLRSGDETSSEAALLALLNIAVRDERNKIKIVAAGALSPILGFLRSPNKTLQEHATAALLTLTASATNKPAIGGSGAVPILVGILRHGTPQAKIDAVMALYNLSTLPDALGAIMSVRPVGALVDLLKSCEDKSSKAAEKCSALLELLLGFEEGRSALAEEEGGVLSVVEVVEEGSLQSREHAVGALLKMCENDRPRYREAILKEGAIPGLLELTVQGTSSSQRKARSLLQLLRESPYTRQQLGADTLENIVSSIVSQMDGGEGRVDRAREMLAEMVQVSMERSLRHLQQRAKVCTTGGEGPQLGKCASKLPMK